ncbi:MAG: pyridoxine 5'-phosphate synthase [Myxococcales bacterium]|nr:pyridoxine 5'-phosphate synthase [Myxococcales bacterium]
MAIALSVNLNKVALLRNSRGHDNPSPLVAARACLDAGAHGITLHWRADNRHTRKDDVIALRALCAERGVEFNLEGDARAELIDLADELRVDQFTLVPVSPGEITSDHGWDLPRDQGLIAPIITRLRGRGIRTAIFMDAVPGAMANVPATGVDRVELYTEPYAAAFGGPDEDRAFDQLAASCAVLAQQGIGVNAGHDLDLRNLPRMATQISNIKEVSIGHALIADALYLGLAETIRRYLRALAGERVQAPTTR